MDADNLKIGELNNLEAFSKSITVYDKAGFPEHVEACGGDLMKWPFKIPVY
jgi:hypothetical protein